MYSFRILASAKRAWDRLNNILHPTQKHEFKTLEEFDQFYSVLIEKLHKNDNEQGKD